MFSAACFNRACLNRSTSGRCMWCVDRSHTQCRQATSGVRMLTRHLLCRGFAALTLALITLPAAAQTFMVQCPTSTLLHPNAPTSAAGEPAYTGPTNVAGNAHGVALTYRSNGGAVKCQQISGGDGFMTEADGNQTFMFSFGPLSGMDAIKHGQPGTQFASVFNNHYNSPTLPSSPNSRNPTYDPSRPVSLNGAVADPAAIMTIGVLNGNLPMPLAAFDEDDEFFLTLSNVGMIMRPDLFEQHTVHFHGYPNASSFYDGVPDATWAINIGGSATYYYMAPDAGTYFYHCHITPPEHLQMGMVGQIYVRPRQNRCSGLVSDGLQRQQSDLRTKCDLSDILCSNELPAVLTSATNDGTQK